MIQDKIIRKVKEQYTADRMLQIADENLICATYSFNGRWYVVEFECTHYEFAPLNVRLKREFKKY